ncbi:hypothetical protein [Paenibacillus sp. PL2-23]
MEGSGAVGVGDGWRRMGRFKGEGSRWGIGLFEAEAGRGGI